MHFKNRVDAGEQLAKLLATYYKKPDTVILGLPRGGVVTAAVIAKKLNLPLDIVVPRKIGVPGNPELAVGAITEDGTTIFNHKLMHELNITPQQLQPTIDTEQQEAARRLALYRHSRPPLVLIGKTVIIVDDGIATGATMQAAIASARKRGATTIVVAVPVSPSAAYESIKKEVDSIFCLLVTDQFWGISDFYDDFHQTSDEEVMAHMQQSRAP